MYFSYLPIKCHRAESASVSLEIRVFLCFLSLWEKALLWEKPEMPAEDEKDVALSYGLWLPQLPTS